MKANIRMHPYQKELLSKMERGILSGRRVVITAPRGSYLGILRMFTEYWKENELPPRKDAP